MHHLMLTKLTRVKVNMESQNEINLHFLLNFQKKISDEIINEDVLFKFHDQSSTWLIRGLSPAKFSFIIFCSETHWGKVNWGVQRDGVRLRKARKCWEFEECSPKCFGTSISRLHAPFVFYLTWHFSVVELFRLKSRTELT